MEVENNTVLLKPKELNAEEEVFQFVRYIGIHCENIRALGFSKEEEQDQINSILRLYYIFLRCIENGAPGKSFFKDLVDRIREKTPGWLGKEVDDKKMKEYKDSLELNFSFQIRNTIALYARAAQGLEYDTNKNSKYLFCFNKLLGLLLFWKNFQDFDVVNMSSVIDEAIEEIYTRFNPYNLKLIHYPYWSGVYVSLYLMQLDYHLSEGGYEYLIIIFENMFNSASDIFSDSSTLSPDSSTLSPDSSTLSPDSSTLSPDSIALLG